MVALAVRDGGRYIDGTVGDGGHTLALLRKSAPGGRVLGLDRDDDALTVARQRLAEWAERCVLVQENFAELDDVADAAGFESVDGVLFDFGVRSDQLDRAERGFSFMRAGPLDMRMDQRQSVTAADLVNELSAQELARAFRRLGEENAAWRIAQAIVARRTITRFEQTEDLAAVIEAATGGRRGRIHPATKAFMALRMMVNAELEAIQAGVAQAVRRVAVGGRVAVITYHSGEDRVVKRLFAEHVGRWESLQAGGEEWKGSQPRCTWMTRKPIVPSAAEIERNPRARSAKLRVVERTE